jgi:tRNA A37 threonylcarbamoyladenosine biosynthesis protein TsaE
MIIKGKWGVGKTYFWNGLINSLRSNNELHYKKYVYISLFGIKDIETVKGQLTASYLLNRSSSSRIGKALTWFANRELQKTVGKLSENIPYVKYVNILPIELANAAAFILVKDAIICIDDFERKAEQLKTKEILGLADLLKDQRNCKIVFILNQDQLEVNDRDEFQGYTEKVVDWSFIFAPTPEILFDYVFSSEFPFYEEIKLKCLLLRIENVRVLKRISSFLEEIIPQMENIEENIKKDAIRSLILYVWCHYEREVKRPTFEFLKSYTSYLYDLRKRHADLQGDNESDEFHLLLMQYRYEQTDEVDKCLMEYVEQGYLNVDAFKEHIAAKNRKYLIQSKEDTYSSAWNLYKYRLGNNEKEFVDHLIESFRLNTETLSIGDLQAVAQILTDLGQMDKAASLIDEYVSLRVTSDDVVKMYSYPDFDKTIQNTYLKEIFQKLFETVPQKTFIFNDAIKKIGLANPNEFLHDELKFLSEQSSDKFYDFFKSLSETDDLYIIIRSCLKHNETLRQTQEALRQIARESQIDMLRVTRIYGITLEENLPNQI